MSTIQRDVLCRLVCTSVDCGLGLNKNKGEQWEIKAAAGKSMQEHEPKRVELCNTFYKNLFSFLYLCVSGKNYFKTKQHTGLDLDNDNTTVAQKMWRTQDFKISTNSIKYSL